MPTQDWLNQQAQLTLQRLLPRLEAQIRNKKQRAIFHRRLVEQFPRLFSLLYGLYGERYDFFYHLEQTLLTAATYFTERPADLSALDAKRERDRAWIQHETMVAAVVYVDLFAGDFASLRGKIPYFQELGITYLHLMPLFRAPEENSDGGYAVSSYRDTHPALGTIDELRALAAEFRTVGISLSLDFIFNHTSNEHEWALAACNGDERYKAFYRIYPDRTIPDQYQATLREIFPEQAPGSFTWVEAVNGWVWTTFYPFQWDLNYENPEVLTAMMGEMLALANVGVEILRLDAVAFVWKQLGTTSENLPQAHDIIRALNALAQIVAPSMLFLSEAIVHPDDVVSYVDWEECPISYNPTLMAMIWDALATRRADVMTYAMQHRFDLPQNCVWLNYLRVHDDIGWSFADEDAARFNINGYDHRRFLNRFYTGAFEGSFAMGEGFNYNPVNQDMRIVGTLASLAGLEQAITQGDKTLLRLAIERILMAYSVILSIGGIPLIYQGDEIATLNDQSYKLDPKKAADSRWIHRAAFDWQRAAQRHDPTTPQGEIYTRLLHMIHTRKATPTLGASATRFFESGSPHVLSYVRDGSLICLHNFSEHPITVPRTMLVAHAPIPATPYNLAKSAPVALEDALTLQPYDYVWLGATP